MKKERESDLRMNDFLNKNNSRNYQNSNYSDYNCGGFALKTFSWYKPCDYDEEELVDILNHYSDIYDGGDEYPNFLDYINNDILVQKIFEPTLLKDFQDRHIHKVKSVKEVNFELEDLIAFRTGVETDFRDQYLIVDFDFHFRLYNSHFNKWYEKCGKCCPRIALKEWYDDYDYNSDTFLYALDTRNSNLTFAENSDIIIHDDVSVQTEFNNLCECFGIKI